MLAVDFLGGGGGSSVRGVLCISGNSILLVSVLTCVK